MNENLARLIDYLRGTCKSFEEGLQDCNLTELDLGENYEADLDSEIFLCEACGWWCDTDEMTESQTCEDCND